MMFDNDMGSERTSETLRCESSVILRTARMTRAAPALYRSWTTFSTNYVDVRCMHWNGTNMHTSFLVCVLNLSKSTRK